MASKSKGYLQLPALDEQQISVGAIGEWSDDEQLLQLLMKHIDVRGKMASSNIEAGIPTLWSRAIMFEKALLDKTHPLHEQIKNDWLGVLAILLFHDNLFLQIKGFDLYTQEYSFSHEATKLDQALMLLKPQQMKSNDKLKMIFVNGILVGAFHPKVLFFTPPQFDEGLSQFVPWFRQKSNNPNQQCRFGDILKYFERENAEKRFTSKDYRKIVEALEDSSSREGRLEIGKDVLQYISDKTKSLPKQPGVSHQVQDRVLFSEYYCNGGNYVFVTGDMLDVNNSHKILYGGFTVGQMQADIRDVLEGRVSEGTELGSLMCKWINPERIFFNDKIVSRPTTENTYTHNASHEGINLYIPPLSPRVLEFFTPEQIGHMFTFEENSADKNGIKAVLKIHFEDGNMVKYERSYSSKDVLKVDPYPLGIYPDFKSSDDSWNLYYVIYDNEKSADYSIDVYIAENLKDNSSQGLKKKYVSKHLEILKQPYICRLESYPEAIVYKYRGEPVGLILPKSKNTISKGYKTASGISFDFGTSNSCWMLKENVGSGDIRSIDFDTKTLMTLLEDKYNYDEFIYSNFALVEEKEYMFPSAYILKSQYVTANDDPQKSGIVFFADLRKWEALTNYRPGSPAERTKNRLLSNLKWANQSQRLHINSFVMYALLLIVIEMRKQGFKSADRVLFAFPLSMAKNQRQALQNSFMEAVESLNELGHLTGFTLGEVELHSESVAAAEYSRLERILQPNALSPQVTMDIGGGTVDIAIWVKNKLLLQTSSFFGANVIPNYLKELIDHGDTKDVTDLKEVFNEVLVKVGNSSIEDHLAVDRFLGFNLIMRESGKDIAKVVRRHGGGKLVGLRKLIFFMFSAFFFHVGQLLRYCYAAEPSLDTKPSIAVTGNGGKLLGLVGIPGTLNDKLSRLVSAGVNGGKSIVLTGMNLKSPKESIVKGLLKSIDNPALFNLKDLEEQKKSPVCESGYEIMGQSYDIESDLPEFEEVKDLDKIKVPDDFEELKRFINAFEEEWNNIEEGGAVISYTKSKNRLITHLQGELRGMLEGNSPWESLFIKEIKWLMSEIWKGAHM